MKCKSCSGTGTWGKVFVEDDLVDTICPYCKGTGAIQMTNEEWMKSANTTTEELAEFLTKVDEKFPCGTLLKCNLGCGLFKKCISDDNEPTNEEAWVEWLKQPHTKETKWDSPT